MRVIKFRVWDNVDYMSTLFTLQDLQDNKVQFTSDCIIMQYTGLKDKNNIDIYEGDIVKCYDHPTNIESVTDEIYFSHGNFRVKNSIVLLSDYGTIWTEIIGNIYNP